MEIDVKVQYKNDKLQAARIAAGLSQSQLAGKAEISVRVLQGYESGVRDLNGARFSTLLKLCNALQCGLSDILSDPAVLELLRVYENKS